VWLSHAPTLSNGKRLIKDSSIASAQNALFNNISGLTPNNCNIPPPITDKNGFGFSACGPANGFGVGWAVNSPAPIIQHNGSNGGVLGSNTLINQPQKMGATGLISTEPSPGAPPAPPATAPPVPPTLDTGFMDTVVRVDLLDTATTADQTTTTWQGQALAEGVARVLYLSGKTYSASDLNAFTSGFLSGSHLTSSNIVKFLQTWHSQVGICGTFRVRGTPSSTEADVTFHCKNGDWETVLTVEASAPYQISWPLSSGPSAPQQCLDKCSTTEGTCMGNATSSAQRQQCILTQKVCLAACQP
jgi:hypothetical protein